MDLKFRLLDYDEIDVRVNTVSEKGVTLLLYKNARVDMDMLDEKVGALNWQRRHYLIGDNLHCEVSIWDSEKACWVSKSDVGTESNTEKEKGQASDSFKRACVNWGIGRELYTAPPLMFVGIDKIKTTEKNGKKTTYDKFFVDKITYVDRRIDGIAIVNQDGVRVYTHTPKAAK